MDLSPRQLWQVVLFGGFLLVGILFLVLGVVVQGVALIAVALLGSASLLSYYALGGQPLDRGGIPFWRRPVREWLSSSPPRRP